MNRANDYDLSDDERYGEPPTEEELAIGRLMTGLPPMLKEYDELKDKTWWRLQTIQARMARIGIASEAVARSIDILEVGVVSGDDIRDELLYEHGIEVD